MTPRIMSADKTRPAPYFAEYHDPRCRARLEDKREEEEEDLDPAHYTRWVDADTEEKARKMAARIARRLEIPVRVYERELMLGPGGYSFDSRPVCIIDALGLEITEEELAELAEQEKWRAEQRAAEREQAVQDLLDAGEDEGGEDENYQGGEDEEEGDYDEGREDEDTEDEDEDIEEDEDTDTEDEDDIEDADTEDEGRLRRRRAGQA